MKSVVKRKRICGFVLLVPNKLNAPWVRSSVFIQCYALHHMVCITCIRRLNDIDFTRSCAVSRCRWRFGSKIDERSGRKWIISRMQKRPSTRINLFPKTAPRETNCKRSCAVTSNILTKVLTPAWRATPRVQLRRHRQQAPIPHSLPDRSKTSCITHTYRCPPSHIFSPKWIQPKMFF